MEYTHTEELTALALLPKNRFYLCGDAGGNLLLLDLTSNECLHELKIHEKAVNNIVVHDQCKAFNGLVIMTTEVNRKVNFLELFLNKKTQKIELAVVNSVYLKEDIRNAAFTNNGEMYAISLLNNNIQIYYCNTHKLFLELYGHSLPIVSFDITSDDDMLISGGSDKSIKVWAMDFGNCKKTLKAH